MRPSGDLISTRAPWQGWRGAVRTPLQRKSRVRRGLALAEPLALNSPGGLHADHPTDQGETKMVATDVDTLSAQEHGIQLRRAVIAATVGTAIEWYDFFLYSVVTGLVFAQLYFPKSDPLVGTLEAFTIYAVGFLAPPIGAAIFGHFRDRIGRKSALIATQHVMGIARFLAERRVERAPIREVLRRHPKEIVLSMFARMAEQAPFYIFTAFVFAYGVGTLKLPRDFLLVAVLSASVVSFVSIPLFGHISDLIGRTKMYMLGAIVTAVFGFIYFGMLGSGSRTLIFLAIVLSLIPHDMLYGPQAALIAESFKGRVRYSGASLGYQLASVIAGGPAPFIAAWLFARYHSAYAIGGYIAACGVVSMLAVSRMTDYAGKDIEGDFE